MTIEFMKGNEVIGAAAIKAGCRYFFGYPITPQSELPEYMARELPKVGGVFLQAESEIAAINMVYGASGAGARVMTSSSSPGISLKMEGISYIAGAELPCLIVNIVRGGPGLGGIQPAQSDYFQAVKGGGHGDYRLVVLAPNSIQELSDLVMEGFDIADQYRNPVMILGDGMLGQMMEAVEFREPKKRNLPPKNWATSLNNTSSKKIINSLYIQPKDLENHNLRLHKKYEEIKKNETKYEKLETDISSEKMKLTIKAGQILLKDYAKKYILKPANDENNENEWITLHKAVNIENLTLTFKVGEVVTIPLTLQCFKNENNEYVTIGDEEVTAA
jgi:2-oxoglutarate ferredoxin oxidoreductase subunit alpha